MMYAWRVWVVMAGLSVLLPASAEVSADQTTASVSAKYPELQSRLEKGLRARRPKEFVFIKGVVVHVENEDLPFPLVIGVFRWAREKDRHRPFVYFARVIRYEAKMRDLELPN